MVENTKTIYLDALEKGWGDYVQRFQRFTPEEQRAVLKQQGYARLADLLAHVIAWWEEGLEAVRRLPGDPSFSSPEHDVNSFNAAAVARFQPFNEPEVIERFETLRQAWVDLVESLPESALASKQIADRLYIELVGHLQEHQF